MKTRKTKTGSQKLHPSNGVLSAHIRNSCTITNQTKTLNFCLLIALNHLSKTHIEWKSIILPFRHPHQYVRDGMIAKFQFPCLRSFISLAAHQRPCVSVSIAVAYFRNSLDFFSFMNFIFGASAQGQRNAFLPKITHCPWPSAFALFRGAFFGFF